MPIKRGLRGLTFCVSLLLFVLLGGSASAVEKPDIIEVISVAGEIRDALADRVRQQVEKINDNKRVRAVLLELDSPGGGVHATDAAYQELNKLKVPVIVWCNNECASGAYYLAMADPVRWVAVRGLTVTGSVGVVMHNVRYHRLLEWAKIDAETYRSGDLKDAGNPERPATDAERKYLQGIIDELAQHFYALVLSKRQSVSADDVVALKTGKIVFGRAAVAMRLADAVMTRDEAVKKAKELSGSANAYTREEIQKMSQEAQGEQSSYGGGRYGGPRNDAVFGDVPWLIEALKQARSGQSVEFLYLMPYRF